MEEFDFDEKEMSTSIQSLRKKKTELDDEKSYNNIRNRLYDELNAPPLQQTSVYVPDEIKPIRKQKKLKKKKQMYSYQSLFVFAIIFFIVNVYELNVYLNQQKLSYYTIVLIKLLIFIVINYVYKTLFLSKP